MLSHLIGSNLSNSKLINMLFWSENSRGKYSSPGSGISAPLPPLLPPSVTEARTKYILHLSCCPSVEIHHRDYRNYPVAEFIIMSCHKNSHKYSSQIVTQNRGKGTEYWRRPATVGGCITGVSLWGQCMEGRLLEDAGAELQEGKIECFWSNSFCCLMFECRMTCRPPHGSMNSQPDHLAILDSTRIEANHDKQTANIT